MSHFGSVIFKKLARWCLPLIFLWTAGHQNMALPLGLPGFAILTEIPAINLPVAEAISDFSPQWFISEPCISISQKTQPVSSHPDKVEKNPSGKVPSESCRKLETLIKKYAALHRVDEELVWAVMRHESGFDPRAVSPKGAMGLMQLMPGTAALLGVKDPFNVEQNIQGGIRYLEMCLTRFDQDVGLALAAYNAGPGNVDKYKGCPPFPETEHYVATVLQDYSGLPQHQALRLRIRGPASLPEVVEPPQPSGLQWNLPAPVVKVAKPTWRLRPPQWRSFTWPGRQRAVAAQSPDSPDRLALRE